MDSIATYIWQTKYSNKLKDKSFEDTIERMANAIADVELKFQNPFLTKDLVYDMLEKFVIIPGGSIWASLGTDSLTSLSNCFVIKGPEDSYESIFKTEEKQVHLMKRRGGVGHDLSRLRPKDAPVNNSANTSSGAASFTERYSNSTKEVAQDGRRGALMLTLHINHPDSPEFIEKKSFNEDSVRYANLSVKFCDEFMQAVLHEKHHYILRFPLNLNIEDLRISNPDGSLKYEFNKLYSYGNGYIKLINPVELWKKFINCSWKSAEPGALFWDTIMTNAISNAYGERFTIEATNPCGEIPLSPNNGCRLMHIPFEVLEFSDTNLRFLIKTLLRIQDNIIECELDHIHRILQKLQSENSLSEIKLWEDIYEVTRLTREIGIGFTGVADHAALNNLKYASQKHLSYIEPLLHRFYAMAYEEDHNLALERGSFPLFDRSKEIEFCSANPESHPARFLPKIGYVRRHLGLFTVAPTGSISILAGYSSGIEPVFDPYYFRKLYGKDTLVIHPKLQEWLIKNEREIDMNDLAESVKGNPWEGSYAYQIDYKDKVKLQALFQKYVDHSISVTINLPENISEDVVNELFITAWQLGCKGLTVYREGSRDGILKTAESVKKSTAITAKRPESLEAKVHHFKVFGEPWIAFIGLMNGLPYELFLGVSESKLDIPDKGIITRSPNKQYFYKSGDTYLRLDKKFNPVYWNYAKLISGYLRLQQPIESVIKTISNLNFSEEGITSWKAGVIRVLNKYIVGSSGKQCPRCESTLYYTEGCLICYSCGYSECN